MRFTHGDRIVKVSKAKEAVFIGRVIAGGFTASHNIVYVCETEDNQIFLGFDSEMIHYSDLVGTNCKHNAGFYFGFGVQIGPQNYQGAWSCCKGCRFSLPFNPDTFIEGIAYTVEVPEEKKEFKLARSSK